MNKDNDWTQMIENARFGELAQALYVPAYYAWRESVEDKRMDIECMGSAYNALLVGSN
jgi:hypothetical protein